MMDTKEYLAGVELFNRGAFWHAHEEWEIAWKGTDDPHLRLFYQGIIQTAAALVHWQRGNPRGIHLNWAKARPKLASLPSPMLGLDLRELIARMDRFEAVEGVAVEPPRLDIHPERDLEE
jgi:uncharacterized protein